MTAENPVDSVKVRMYRHGFGDCFLLLFFQDDNRVFTMLVDCGIKHNTKSVDVPIEDVINDLRTTLTPEGGTKPQLDVLVATHEHWDHISFFHPERSPNYFGDFDIGQVWLAWTENPEDEEAVAINSRLRDGVAALQIAAMQLQSSQRDETRQLSGMNFGGAVAAARGQFNTAMDNVMGFYGISLNSLTSDGGIKYKQNGTVSVETEVAMSHIVKLGQYGSGIKYFLPGTKVDKQSLPTGVNVYVLGPPRSSLINKSNPSAGAAHETYLGIDQSGLSSFIDGLLQLNSAGVAEGGAGPFSDGIGITIEEAQSDPYFQSTYFFPREKYRRIDHNWLDIAGQFALQLDGAINNTSLVLAIELAGSRKVLLFPGDAQVGSWLSWHDHKWQVERDLETVTLTAKDLLNNTVLYKVSHHGSHNATIKANGLELMTHPELVAMMPEKEGSYGGIPYEPLMTRLKELCKGRVLVSADVNFPPEELIERRPREMTATEWSAFRENVTVNRLYVEYTVR